MGKGRAVARPVSTRSTRVSTQSTPVRGQSTPIVVAAKPAMRKERAEGSNRPSPGEVRRLTVLQGYSGYSHGVL
jgi:hypothetical protein